MRQVKAVLKCEESLKEKIGNAKCLITISVGQEVHEGEKFLATVDLANSSFGSCVLLIDDSLQRHSMALNSTHNADFYYEKSIALGNEWLERNEKYYKDLKNLEQILRWDHWLKHSKY